MSVEFLTQSSPTSVCAETKENTNRGYCLLSARPRWRRVKHFMCVSSLKFPKQP